MSEHWTTNNIPDLKDKVVIITGANVGIGLETAKAFAQKNAHTILACRNLEKAETALSQIHTEVPEASAEVMQLDLASLASIRQFADTFKGKHQRLDVLANNAGLTAVPYSKTEDGFELVFGTNHFGHFALTGLLMERIAATPGARVVTVSSIGHRNATIDFDDFIYEAGKQYSSNAAYGRSKLANLLFTYELQHRFKTYDMDALALAAHPGTSQSNLLLHIRLFDFLYPLLKHLLQTSEMGALPTLRAAVDPDVHGGEYFGPSGRFEFQGHPVLVQSNEASHNREDAKRLWEVSEELTGVKFL